MTKIDFYLLNTDSLEYRLNYACKLIEKVYQKGHRILVVAEEVEARQLDKRLWDYKPESFIPHGLITEDDTNLPVHISWDLQDAKDHNDVLINLGIQSPEYFSRFTRMLEVICQEESIIKEGRSRYKFYKDRGYPLTMHKLEAN